MFERFRDAIASGLSAIVARIATEPRYTGQDRIPVSSRTIAGVAITPDTAVTVPAVWACLRYLSQTVAVLPWHVMRTARGGNGIEVASDNSVDWLLWQRPNPEWSAFQFRETLTHWALRWGNGYAEIERDGAGRPAALWPIHPERVDVCRDPETKELYYEVNNGSGGKVEIEARDMFHIRGFGEGPVGVNVIAYAAQSIGWAKAAQIFGAAFFGNGANVGGVVTNKKPLKEDGLRRQKAEFEQLYKGPRNASKVAFLDNEAAFTPIGIDPDKAQFILTHQHLVEEVCRWFGVPPHKVMHMLRSTFNNIEHQAIEVVVDSIAPWVKRFEDEANYKLFGGQRFRGLYTKINMNALLRGDHQSRMEFYKGLQFVGALSPNEIRALEDMNSLGEDGDVHVMQQQMVPLEFIAEGPVQPEPTAPAAGAAAPAIEEDDDAVAARAAFSRAMEMA